MSVTTWMLYNNKTEESIEALMPEKAIEHIFHQPVQELPYWFVWFEGLSSWEPVLKRAEFAAAVERMDEEVTLAPEPEIEKTQVDFDPQSAETKPAEKTQVMEHITQMDAAEEVTVTSSYHVGAVTLGVPSTSVAPLTIPVNSTPAPTHGKPTSAPKIPEALVASPAVSSKSVEDDGDPAIHIFWMADSPDEEPMPTSLEELSAKYQPGQATSGNLPQMGPAETSLLDNAVTMPEVTEQNSRERRQFERFDIRYRVIVRNENLTFRTFSKNISLGGVALEMPVPEAMLGSDCQIYVGNPKTGENIRFSGKLVPNRTDAKYFLFLKASSESLVKLQKWVESHSGQKKKTA